MPNFNRRLSAAGDEIKGDLRDFLRPGYAVAGMASGGSYWEYHSGIGDTVGI